MQRKAIIIQIHSFMEWRNFREISRRKRRMKGGVTKGEMNLKDYGFWETN